MTSEDKTLRAENDSANRQTLLYGMGDQHLDIVVNKLKERYKVDVELSKPCCLLYTSTVFTRTPSSEHTYELEFFWSWKQVFQGNKALFEENLLNTILLFPAGLLLPVIYRKTLSWQKGFFSGAFISFGIEFLQLVLARGLFEWDDIVHNGLGCMAGCIISSHFLKNKM